MLKSLIDRPALLVSELGLLVLGVVLATLGFINFAGAFAADNLAFVGAFIFLVAGAWCLSVGLIALLGTPVPPLEGPRWWRSDGSVRPIHWVVP